MKMAGDRSLSGRLKKCSSCGWQWLAYVSQPKKCPKCQSSKWDSGQRGAPNVAAAIAHLDAALAKLNPAPLSRHNAAQDVAMALEELDPGHMTRRAKAITADELIRAQTQREDTP
jgi:primosomal protein N'